MIFSNPNGKDLSTKEKSRHGICDRVKREGENSVALEQIKGEKDKEDGKKIVREKGVPRVSGE